MADMYELKEAGEHWEEIMERVEAGEEIVLVREGKAVAKLVPMEEKKLPPLLGLLAGKGKTSDDFNDPLPNEDYGLSRA